MRLLTALIISVFTFTSCMAVAQPDESEIQLLISKAPVAEAAADAEGEEMIVVFQWVRALAYSGRVQDAYAVAEKVKDKMEDSESISAIADGLSMAGQTDEALAAMRKIKSHSSESIALEILMILIRAERFSQAISEARKVKDVDERAEHLASISKALAKAGRIDEAVSITGEIKGMFAVSFLDDALREISIGLAKAGKSVESLATARKITGKADQEVTLQTVAEELAKTGKVNEALAVSQEIKDEGSRSRSLISVAEALAGAGSIDEASAIVRKTKDNFLLAISLGKMAALLNKAGKKDESQKTLNEALVTARGIKEEVHRDKAISVISIDLAHAGMTIEAKNVIRECKDVNELAWAYDAIAEALVREGKYDEAMTVARSITDGFIQRSTAIARITVGRNAAGKATQADVVKSAADLPPDEQRAVVEGLAAAGKIEEALAIARGIEDKDDRAFAFIDISNSLASSHSYRQARLVADLCHSPLARLGAYFTILTEYAMEKNPGLRSRLEAENPK